MLLLMCNTPNPEPREAGVKDHPLRITTAAVSAHAVFSPSTTRIATRRCGPLSTTTQTTQRRWSAIFTMWVFLSQPRNHCPGVNARRVINSGVQRTMRLCA